MARFDTDLCIIGAGAAGLSLAAGAVQMGARVVLVEAGQMGGDCLNTGCVPSKALLAAARQAETLRRGFPGIAAMAPPVDFPAVMQHLRATIAAIAPMDSQERFEGLGVRVIRAHARFAGPDRVEAGGETIRARRIVIATGARPVLPQLPGLDEVPYLTHETIFDLAALPRHLLVLGAGPVGLELAQAFRRLGAGVTVVEAGPALGREDPDMAAPVLARLAAEGVVLHQGCRVVRVSSDGGDTVLHTDAGVLRGSDLLVATGRAARFDGMALERAGIATGAGGQLRLDHGLRTTNRRVYAIGDAAGRGQQTHLAGFHASVVIRPMLFGLPARADRMPIPVALYTDPGLARVGLTEAEARARHGNAAKVLCVPVSDSDRARAEARTEGLVKLVHKRGKPLGVAICAPDAGELIAPWALILAQNLRLSAIATTAFAYPTFQELNKRVASAYFSPELFDSPVVKALVRSVQRVIP